MSALALQLDYEGRNFRMAGTPDAPLFVAADVCSVLELVNPSDVCAKQLDADERGLETIYTPSGPQQMLVVTEPGLYKLIARSRKPAAKRFDRWVRHEVLPCIRKHGCYPEPVGGGKNLAVVQRDDDLHRKMDAFGIELSHLKRQVGDGFSLVVSRVEDIARGLPVVRRDFTASTRRRMATCALRFYRGACPACGVSDVVDGDGQLVGGAEFDHWLNRNDNSAECGWIVCRKCNGKLRHAGSVEREEFRPAFTLFQQRLKDVREVKALRVDPRQSDLFGGGRR